MIAPVMWAILSIPSVKCANTEILSRSSIAVMQLSTRQPSFQPVTIQTRNRRNCSIVCYPLPMYLRLPALNQTPSCGRLRIKRALKVGLHRHSGIPDAISRWEVCESALQACTGSSCCLRRKSSRLCCGCRSHWTCITTRRISSAPLYRFIYMLRYYALHLFIWETAK